MPSAVKYPRQHPKSSLKKRFFRSLFQHPVSAWLLWMIIGAILYDFVIKGIELLAIGTVSLPLLAFVGVISIAACGELATTWQDSAVTDTAAGG